MVCTAVGAGVGGAVTLTHDTTSQQSLHASADASLWLSAEHAPCAEPFQQRYGELDEHSAHEQTSTGHAPHDADSPADLGVGATVGTGVGATVGAGVTVGAEVRLTHDVT